MDGVKYFKEFCESMGLDCNRYFQLGKSRTVQPERLRHRFDLKKRTPTQLFTVCYFEVDNIYIAWDLKEKKAKQKTIFTVDRTSLALPLKEKLVSIKKAIEHPSWGEENVLVFTPEGVTLFLEKCCEDII